MFRVTAFRGLRPASMLLAISVLSFALADSAAAQSVATLYAVTPTNRLLTVSSADPGTVLRSVPITNLAPSETIVGIDVRPANRLLYGLGSTSQLYLINHVTGAAIRVGVPFTPALQGTAFGVDFNPTVDRIRIVSNTGQNLRLHPDTGVVAGVDSPLAFAGTDVNAGRPATVTAVGYTNPDTDPATGTTLFDIDTGLDVGVIQNPPNNGVLNTFQALGFDTSDRVSLDLNLTDAFVAAQRTGDAMSSLYQVRSGATHLVGMFGGGEPVSGLAVSLGTPSTPPIGRVFGVTGANELISFAADMPSQILTRVPITNLAAGERVLGIDFRPANNLLYALGSSGQLYIVDPVIGAAGRVGPPLAVTLSGNEFGFDFNPTVDRMRVVSDAGQNLRLHPETGAVAAVDGALSYATTDANGGRTPRVVAAGYTNPDNDPATGTTLFVVDSGLDIAAIQDPPNAGILNTFARLGLDVGDVLGLDLSRTRILVMAMPAGTSATLLFDATASPRFLGAIGSGEIVRDIAISLGR